MFSTRQSPVWGAADLDVGRQVSEIAAPVCPLQFYRSFVGPNKPALITGRSQQALGIAKLSLQACCLCFSNNSRLPQSRAGAIDDWPALKLWTSEYLTYATQDQQVSAQHKSARQQFSGLPYLCKVPGFFIGDSGTASGDGCLHAQRSGGCHSAHRTRPRLRAAP